MIGPVSGTGRAMMASLQQAMSKGMPPDQAIQYVKSMATQGIAPLADLYAMMNQFQRLKQQPVKPPQTPPTIRDELNMAEQMQAQGGMPPQMMGGAPQMPGGGGGGPQMPPPMAQGLGSMNAGAMENPSFAGGGIVAFQEGGTAEIDFSKMASEQLQMLMQDEDKEVAKAAYREYLRRSGYRSPGELASDIGTGVSEFFANTRLVGGAPEYMKDAQGRIRTPATEAGAPGVTASFTEGMVPRGAPPAATPEVAATQSAMPGMSADNPYANPAAAGSAFDLMAANARTGVRQENAAPPRREAPMPSMSGFQRMELPVAKSRDQFYEELKAAQQKEGIGEAARKREEYLTSEEARLKKEYGSDKMLAFAEAGFKMAGAASRPGATFLGALSEGAMSGTQALRALNKEQRASRRAMDEARFQLAEAAEQRKLGNMRDATILSEKAKEQYEQAQKYNMELNKDITMLNMQLEASRENALIAAGDRAESRALAGKGFQLQSLQAQIDNAKSRLAQAAKSLEPDAAAKVAEIEREIAFYNKQIAELGGTTSYAGAGAGNIIDFNSLP